ncbi:DUF1129 family protein [Alkalihalobacterium elongatum]|uniref:DUF1129 family protein n=1 Tax=Alkalihalobacterium elongatum TaxID=2675466 RepID=UPI001F24F819|nr:DUF1129 family protein [Alkalihalobacterium elongatum]
MKAQELIKLNNNFRNKLTEENRKYYEDMLVYIRLSYDKSEQETEEILSELLGHLIEAQEEGKTVKDFFGSEPKKYADHIIGELPKMLTKERLFLGSMAIFYFLGVSVFFIGLVRIFNQYVVPIGGMTNEYYILSVAVKTLVSIPIAVLLLLDCVAIFKMVLLPKYLEIKGILHLMGLGYLFYSDLCPGILFYT